MAVLTTLFLTALNLKRMNVCTGKEPPVTGFATEEQFAAAFGMSSSGETVEIILLCNQMTTFFLCGVFLISRLDLVLPGRDSSEKQH
jgi:hypothetical protein